MTKEQILIQSANEIDFLRDQLSKEREKLSIYESMIALFQTNPNQNTKGMMHPDLAQELRKMAEDQNRTE